MYYNKYVYTYIQKENMINSEVFSVRAVKPIELRSRQKELLDLAYNGEILIVARPARKNVVVLSEDEFNKRDKALKDIEYLNMLDSSLDEARNGQAYEYIGKGKFKQTPVKIDV